MPFTIRQETFKGVTGFWIINTTWGCSLGGAQIRSIRSDYTGPMNAADKLRVAADLLDPVKNAKAMFAISKGGTDFTLWSTFRDRAYEKFLDVDFALKTGYARADDWDY